MLRLLLFTCFAQCEILTFRSVTFIYVAGFQCELTNVYGLCVKNSKMEILALTLCNGYQQITECRNHLCRSRISKYQILIQVRACVRVCACVRACVRVRVFVYVSLYTCMHVHVHMQHQQRLSLKENDVRRR